MDASTTYRLHTNQLNPTGSKAGQVSVNLLLHTTLKSGLSNIGHPKGLLQYQCIKDLTPEQHWRELHSGAKSIAFVELKPNSCRL